MFPDSVSTCIYSGLDAPFQLPHTLPKEKKTIIQAGLTELQFDTVLDTIHCYSSFRASEFRFDTVLDTILLLLFIQSFRFDTVLDTILLLLFIQSFRFDTVLDTILLLLFIQSFRFDTVLDTILLLLFIQSFRFDTVLDTILLLLFIQSFRFDTVLDTILLLELQSFRFDTILFYCYSSATILLLLFIQSFDTVLDTILLLLFIQSFRFDTVLDTILQSFRFDTVLDTILLLLFIQSFRFDTVLDTILLLLFIQSFRFDTVLDTILLLLFIQSFRFDTVLDTILLLLFIQSFRLEANGEKCSYSKREKMVLERYFQQNLDLRLTSRFDKQSCKPVSLALWYKFLYWSKVCLCHSWYIRKATYYSIFLHVGGSCQESRFCTICHYQWLHASECVPVTDKHHHRPLDNLHTAYVQLTTLGASNTTEGATMREEEVEVAIKVVVVGNGAVGKSSMIQRYCKGIFTRDYKKTIGVDFLERQIEVEGEDVRLMLWDTAGQEEFDAITKAYYRGAQACVLAFSTVDRESFEAIESWKQKVEDEVGEIAMVIVQNKIDLIDDALVHTTEAENLAKKLRLRFYPTSVKENLNVEEVFKYLAEKHLERMNTVMETDTNTHQIGEGLMHSDSPNHSSSKHSKQTISLQPSKRRTHGKKSVFTQKCLI
ncbi:hypothetical protein RRG08_034806 [Elysia crispata]|uniref:Ras-related protein Rab-23 n=1 Tax=Elysia crispata TaxID=231223 RepID=A0AAE1AP69_9GAST|nr:hypothetical protein RRG08_034806 [Elysia crispata]